MDSARFRQFAPLSTAMQTISGRGRSRSPQPGPYTCHKAVAFSSKESVHGCGKTLATGRAENSR